MKQFKFIALATKGKNLVQHYFLTICLFVIGWQFIGAVPLFSVAANKAGDFATLAKSAQNNFNDLGIDPNLLLILYILMFLGGLIALLLGVKFIHKRSILTVFTSREKLDWQRVFTSFFAWFALSVLVFYAQYLLQPENYEWNFNSQRFAVLCLVAIGLIPIQVAMEELLFRGYLLQGLYARFKNVPGAILVSSVLFGVLHGTNPEVAALGWGVMVFYIGTGIFLAFITVVDEGLELSLGFHAANNIAALLLVTSDWTVIKTDALFIDNAQPSLGADTLFPMLFLYPLLFFFFYKKYGWQRFRFITAKSKNTISES